MIRGVVEVDGWICDCGSTEVRRRWWYFRYGLVVLSIYSNFLFGSLGTGTGTVLILCRGDWEITEITTRVRSLIHCIRSSLFWAITIMSDNRGGIVCGWWYGYFLSVWSDSGWWWSLYFSEVQNLVHYIFSILLNCDHWMIIIGKLVSWSLEEIIFHVVVTLT